MSEKWGWVRITWWKTRTVWGQSQEKKVLQEAEGSQEHRPCESPGMVKIRWRSCRERGGAQASVGAGRQPESAAERLARAARGGGTRRQAVKAPLGHRP